VPVSKGCDMTAKKQKPTSTALRTRMRLEQKLRAVEVQIARLEKDRDIGLAVQDYFIVWKRPCLFAAWSSAIQ